MANLLIVDDDFDVSEIVSDLLQTAGHFVRVAATGQEGLRTLRSAQLPDCVLLDVDMPALSGPQMAHRMLLHDAGEELIPIVLLSGRADLPAIAARIGTPYFLGKPAACQVLLDLLDRALRERIAPSFAGIDEELGVAAPGRAAPTPEREITDESLREERDKGDAARRERSAAIEVQADRVVNLARVRADEVLSKAREEEAEARRRHPVTAEALAETRRQGRAADRITRSERATADEALGHERTEHHLNLDAFLEAERTLTDSSLADERLHSDIHVTSRDEFLGMVSHDLRALLSGIALNVSLIKRSAAPGDPGEATRKRTTSIERVIGRMSRLIGDLNDVASIEAGKLSVVPEPADARQMVIETIEAFEELARSKQITIEFRDSADEGALAARLDHGRVVQVLANLLSNAIKFTQPGGRIVVDVCLVDGNVHFSVADNGPGIPPELLTAIFERYRQIRADRRGLGLGLYIAKGIVETHGGRIWAESQFGSGSTFHFAIPRNGLSAGMGVHSPDAVHEPPSTHA